MLTSNPPSRTRGVSLLLAPLAVASLTVACTNGSVAIERFSTEMASAQCRAIDRCGRLPGGLAQCGTILAAQIQNSSIAALQPAVINGTVIYDGDAAAQCIASIGDTACDVLVEASVRGAPPGACSEVFVGTLETGAVCLNDEDCAGDAYCQAETCPATCAPRPPPAAEGERCSSSRACQSGLDCVAGTCVVRGAGRACEADFACPLSEACVDGTCVDRAAVSTAGLNEACDRSGTPRCREGGVCVAVDVGEGGGPSYECRAPVGSGEPCFSGETMCPDTEYCDVDFMSGSLEGVCAALPAPGEPCGNAGRCSWIAECVDGVCRARQDNGASCTTGFECWSLICNDGVCGPRTLCSGG